MVKRIFFRKGKHAGLSVIGEEDIPFYLESLNDESITRNLMRRFPMNTLEEKEWFAKMHTRQDTDQPFGIVHIESDTLIGSMGLHRIDWINRCATTGAFISDSEKRGKGYASEAKMLLLDYAFHTLGLHKIRSNVLATNEKSRRYNKRCGYKTEGVLKKQIFVYGQFVDEVQMAIFKEDFAPLWEAYRKASNAKD